jgi:AraC-like DNA-binding protein
VSETYRERFHFGPPVSGKSSEPVRFSSDIFFSHNEPVFLSIHDAAGNENIHYHDFFEINYVIDGSPVGIIDSQEIRFSHGDLLLMNPNAVHYFSKYRDGEDIILNIVLPVETFRKSVFLPLLSDRELNAFFIRYQVETRESSFIYLETARNEMEKVLEMMITEYLEERSYSSTIMESLLTVLFSYILRAYGKDRESRNNRVDQILNYIYRNYRSCSLEEMGTHFNYHPKYISALIKKHSGRSFRELLTNIRLQNALQYLTHSALTIEEIVEEIGYQDKSSFYQSFKKEFGKSPGSFRRENRDL